MQTFLDACSIPVSQPFFLAVSCQDLHRRLKVSAPLRMASWWGYSNHVSSTHLANDWIKYGHVVQSGQWGMMGKSGVSGEVFFTLQNAPLHLVWILGLIVWRIQYLVLLQPLCNHEEQVWDKSKVGGQWDSRVGWITYTPGNELIQDFLLWGKRHFQFAGESCHTCTGHDHSISLSAIYLINTWWGHTMIWEWMARFLPWKVTSSKGGVKLTDRSTGCRRTCCFLRGVHRCHGMSPAWTPWRQFCEGRGNALYLEGWLLLTKGHGTRVLWKEQKHRKQKLQGVV